MQNITSANLLQLYPVLKVLPQAVLHELCLPEQIIHLAQGTTVFTEKQPCQGFPLLLSGSIKVIKSTASGREMLLYRVDAGGSCIISSSCLLGHSPYSARGIAETDLDLLVLPKPQFDELLATASSFREFVFHLFAERISNLMGLVEEVTFNRLDQRLAKLLLARQEDTICVTHQQIAEELGSVREIVSRLLKGFSAQGFVLLGREKVTIANRAGLAALAQSIN